MYKMQTESSHIKQTANEHTHMHKKNRDIYMQEERESERNTERMNGEWGKKTGKKYGELFWNDYDCYYVFLNNDRHFSNVL